MPPLTLYSHARHAIRSGDLLLLRRTGMLYRFSRRGPTHVLTAVWRKADQDTLSAAESRELHGGRIINLDEEVERFPGLIDVYTPNNECPDALRERAATIAYNWAGHGYAYGDILEMGRTHLGIGRGEPRDMTLTPWKDPKVCSTLHVWAYRWAKFELYGGYRFLSHETFCEKATPWLAEHPELWDPLPELGERYCWPADLGRSGSYHRRFQGLIHYEDLGKVVSG